MSTDRYIDLVPSENKEKPKFIAWLNASLEMVDAAYQLSKGMYELYDIDTAIGDQLDVIGEWVGVNRVLNFQPVYGPAIMTDDTYRSVIKSKIAQNAWNGTNEQYVTLWDGILPEVPIIFSDNQDMSISVVAITTPDDYVIELINNGYFLIKPQAVGLNFAAVPILFAYDAESLDPLLYSGYDDGYYL